MTPFHYLVTVPSSQTDELGNWHSPYFFLAFFDARKALFESMGATDERLKNEKLAIIVGALECSYSRPLSKGEQASVQMTVINLGRSSMTFRCEVYNAHNQLCAIGKTTQILIDTETRKSTELATWIREPLKDYINVIQ